MSDADGFDESKKGLSIASLVLGIVGFLLSCTMVGFIASILAIIFGAVSINKKQGSKGMAIAGLVLGIVSLIGWILIIIGLGALLGISTVGLTTPVA